METEIETTHRPRLSPIRRIASVLALCALVVTLTATWLASGSASAGPQAKPAAAAATAPAAPRSERPKAGKSTQSLRGKLNLNTATSDQLQLLPGIGPSKADRVIAWRQKNGGFKRVADLRKVKGFGYKTLKKLEPFLDIKGENTLAQDQGL